MAVRRLLLEPHWFYYYDGYYIGYIPQYDPSWYGGYMSSLGNAEAGGEISSTTSNCPPSQMGSSYLGSRPNSAAVTFADFVDPGFIFFPTHYLVPSEYVADQPNTNVYDIGGRNPQYGAFTFGGGGCG